MAKIIAHFRDIDNTNYVPKDITPQHSFFIYTNDANESFVLRGGIYSDLFRDDGSTYNNFLTIDKLSSRDLTLVADKYSKNSIDWHEDHSSAFGEIYFMGSDLIASRIWNSMLIKAQTINDNPTIYKVFFDNCNTALNTLGIAGEAEYKKILFESSINLQSPPAGVFNGINVPINGDSGKLWVPGVDMILDDNNILDKAGNYFDNLKNKLKILPKLNVNLNDLKISAYEGDKYQQFVDSKLIATDAIYVDEKNNPVSFDEVFFVVKDSQLGDFTLVKNNIFTKLKDNSYASIDSIIDSIDQAKNAITNFVQNQVVDFSKSYQDYLISNKDLMLADLATNLILTKSLDQSMMNVAKKWGINAIIANDFVENNFNQIMGLKSNFAQSNGLIKGHLEYIRDNEGNIVKDFNNKPLLQTIDVNDQSITNSEIISGAQAGIVFFISSILLMELQGQTPDSSIYTATAIKSCAIGAMQIYFPDIPVNAIIAFMDGVIEGVNNRDDLDRQGWEDLSVKTSAGVGSAVIGWLAGIKIGAEIGTAIFPGFGTAVGAVAGALIGAIIYQPLNNLIANNVNSIEEIYDAIEDVLIRIDFSSNNLEENIKQTINAIEDFAKDYFINFNKDLTIQIYNLFGGNYGKTYKAGQFPSPYPFLDIVAKDDGLGSIIKAIDSQGVLAIASQYYHDDIYGTNFSDNLIGKSGTNTILGYNGNDHIEGRGDIDLLIGGNGDDEIFGGNGNDQIFGSEGNDNLFAGNGDDIIIGGLGDQENLKNINNNSTLISFENYDDNDFIVAGNGDDKILAQRGNDRISGNAGNDLIFGGIGDDNIEGNLGEDVIFGDEGNDIIFGDNFIINEAQRDSDKIDGGSGNDIIFGALGNDQIAGNDGDDEIYSGSGNDLIYGDQGNDLINAQEGDDLIFAGLGNDVILGQEGDDSINGEFGSDYLFGQKGNDEINGGDGDDIIFGDIGNDRMTGDKGNDIFIYQRGDGDDVILEKNPSENYQIKYSQANQQSNDILKFSDINLLLSDNKTLSVILSKIKNDLIIEFRNENYLINTSDKITIIDQFATDSNQSRIDKVINKIEFADNLVIDLAKISILENDSSDKKSINFNYENYLNNLSKNQEELAFGYNDLFNYTQEIDNQFSTYNSNNYSTSGEIENIENEKYNQVEWKSLKKKRSFFGGHYTVWYQHYEQNITGSKFSDQLVGSWWSENIYGGDSNDQINAGDGNDNLNAGSGSDILHGSAGDDKIYGEAGEDLIYGGSGNDEIFGQADNDSLYGNNGDDVIDGNDGDDYIEGNQGNDLITDNFGNNIIFAGDGNDKIITASGNDKIYGDLGDDIINAGDGNNLIYGGLGSDNIIAQSGNDTIFGQEGFDFINGNAGDDYISGGAGDDNLFGGDGNDKIFGDLGSDQIFGGSGIDFIYGGLNDDQISGEDGCDLIKAGQGDDSINGGNDDDEIFGESGSDQIFGENGDDKIHGGYGGDIIFGGDGNDYIKGDPGNDIMVDGLGSDIIDAGELLNISNNKQLLTNNNELLLTLNNNQEYLDKDIIIITKENNLTNSVDIIKNFDQFNDRIIIDTNYINPISISEVIFQLKQIGKNVEINFDNSQKIIIENTDVGYFNTSNLMVAFSGGENGEILLGSDCDDVIFAKDGDDVIYGKAGNDEIWGQGGIDQLFGENGNDVLRYQADEKFIKKTTLTQYDEVYCSELGSTIFYNYENNSNKIGDVFLKEIDKESDLFVIRDVVTSLQSSRQYYVPPPPPMKSGNYSAILAVFKTLYILRTEYVFELTSFFGTKNFINNQIVDITGYNHSLDKFDGGEGINTLIMTEGNDVLALDNLPQISNDIDASNVENQNSQAISNPLSSDVDSNILSMVKNISIIFAGDGDDIINFTSPKFDYNDLLIYGESGSDKIWLSCGNDRIYGQDGDDEIYSNSGNDIISAGAGSDIVFSGDGDDIIDGSSGLNQLNGENGNDIFMVSNFTDKINGGQGNDLISFINLNHSINVNLEHNQIEYNKIVNNEIFEIENIDGSSFDDFITGNNLINKINGSNGNDILCAKGSGDIYFFNSNIGSDKIIEEINNEFDLDIIEFQADIALKDLKFSSNETDLEIQIGDNENNKITIIDQLKNSGIEGIKLDQLYKINKNIIIVNEDEKILLNNINDLNLTNSQKTNKITNNFIDEKNNFKNQFFSSITSNHGTIIFDENLNQFHYQALNNFFGIDEITAINTDQEISKYSILVNAINDSPTFSYLGEIKDYEIKVEENFSINLRDHFVDDDHDELNLKIKLLGFDKFFDWLNFDEKTGILSGQVGRDGKLNFNISATDSKGLSISDNFSLIISRNLVDDILLVKEVNQISGSEFADIIYTIENSCDLIMSGAGDDQINFTKDLNWQDFGNNYFVAWNPYSNEKIKVSGKNRSYDIFDGQEGFDKLELSLQNDVIFLDDKIISNVGEIAKLSSIEQINGNEGDDIIDLTSFNFIYPDVIIKSGSGNDVAWGNEGNDQISGESGIDNLNGGNGNDLLDGGDDEDFIKGYDGDDLIIGGNSGDIIWGQKGRDQFIYKNKFESQLSNDQELAKIINYDFEKYLYEKNNSPNFQNSSIDVILDFVQQEDLINLSNLGFDSITFEKFSNQSPSGLEYYFKDNFTIIDDPNSNFAIKIIGNIELSNTDFIY